MPFICLRYSGSHSSPLRHVRPAIDPAAFDPGWRPLTIDFPVDTWVRQPYGHWSGLIDGLKCWLLCDGFIARPRRFDAVAPTQDLGWLAEALLRDGVNALDTLRGQYAICFINGGSGEMIAARDRLGGQALYWHRIESVTAVASKSRDLARLPWCGAAENPGFMSECFALHGQHDPDTTAFAHVNEVAPGGCVRFPAHDVRVHRSPLEVTPPPACRTPNDWVDAFEGVFRQAVQDAVGEHGDVAVMLSGGLDSVPVLSTASGVLRGRNRRISAVSWVLPDFPENDESTWIRKAAEAAGIELETFDGGRFMPFSNLSEATLSPELPSYNSFRDILLACYRRASDRGCAMVLAATRGDMIYAQRFAVLDDLIRRKDWPRLWAELGYLYRRLGISGMYRDPAVRYPAARIKKRWRGGVRSPRQAWLTEYAVEHAPERVSWPPEARHYPNPAHAHQLLGPAMTFGTAQENDFCQRFGVERRDPFHSEALVGLMLHAPVMLSHMQGQAKWIMREAMRGRIPEPIRVKERTGILTSFIKAGFARHREQIREFLLDQDDSVWARYVRPAYVRDVLAAPEPPESGLVVICGCIGYTLWRHHWDSSG